MKTNWEKCGFVITSKNRIKVLLCLDMPRTPSNVAKKIKISFTHASKIIRELEKKNIVVCLNPKATKGRIYKRTGMGHLIAKYVSDVEK